MHMSPVGIEQVIAKCISKGECIIRGRIEGRRRKEGAVRYFARKFHLFSLNLLQLCMQLHRIRHCHLILSLLGVVRILRLLGF